MPRAGDFGCSDETGKPWSHRGTSIFFRFTPWKPPFAPPASKTFAPTRRLGAPGRHLPQPQACRAAARRRHAAFAEDIGQGLCAEFSGSQDESDFTQLSRNAGEESVVVA